VYQFEVSFAWRSLLIGGCHFIFPRMPHDDTRVVMQLEPLATMCIDEEILKARQGELIDLR
jgi:hypothetical protein